VRVLPGNIGYVDLDRLESDRIGPCFEQVSAARGLILDLRGYPHGTGWLLASLLNIKGATEGAVFGCPMAGAGLPQGERAVFHQPMAPAQTLTPYRGRVVVLVDETTQSQAEHAVLQFEAACDPVLIGGPTAGSDGDLTDLVLPGTLRVSFSGHEVRHPDGRQLQRVGIQPHIRVAPTLEGLRAGRDEVLERALTVLNEEK
jgi:C-terminal processing protease CtpA/Prc